MQLALLFAVLLVGGCSSDNIYDPQKFFPGHNPHGWSDCEDKFGPVGTGIQICASYFYPPGSIAPSSYAMSYHIPNDEHVRLAVYDEHALLVKVLIDQDRLANLPLDSYPIDWDFTDADGNRVPSGDYRLYFRAGEFVSSSDVEVP